MQSNPPKSKWNPTRGPSWHSAPTASGQAPRFYVHCALYGSSYIPKYQSFPQTPCQAETRTSSPSPQSSSIYSPRDFFLTQALLPLLTCLAWPGQEMHLHFHIKIGSYSTTCHRVSELKNLKDDWKNGTRTFGWLSGPFPVLQWPICNLTKVMAFLLASLKN